MKLVVVESPAKAKTIEKYLGKGYTVKASVGHVRDLPKSNKDAIDLTNDFEPRYVVTPGKERVISELKTLSAKADEVILATDPDREGEAIAWHLASVLGIKNPKRAVFHEITSDAVKNGVGNPRAIDQDLRKAQEARRVLDRLVGYDLSGLIWKKLRYGLSAGRVQSPALRILMEREREVRAFMPEEYWVISANCENSDKKSIAFTYSENPKNEPEAERVVRVAKEGKWVISAIESRAAVRKAPTPYITSTLQQSASTRLGFSPSRTMRTAQKLYEAGLITYMRTDSPALSNDALASIGKMVEMSYGPQYVATRQYSSKSKSAQEAHEAVRPTDITKSHAGGSDDGKKLYNLIWQRTMGSQMADAKLTKVKVLADIDHKEHVLSFSSEGSHLDFPGWLAAIPESREDDVELPILAHGEHLNLKDIQSEKKFTEPPGRYSEAGLIKELEKRGIGRPSTYASIISTIENRDYVEKEGRTLKPTDTGEVVSQFLEEHFADYISDTFTAEMEEKLDDIAEGKREYAATLKQFYGPFNKLVKSKDSVPKITTLGAAPAEIKCPKCGSKMDIKLGRGGKFYSCSKYPKCDGALTLDGSVAEEAKETGEDCAKCGKGRLVERTGKYGSFIACNRYPKCDFIKNDESKQNVNDSGVKCPKCEGGSLVEKRSRFGSFWSCTNYPTCKFSVKAKPTGAKCTFKREDGTPCGELMMEGTKTIPERCSDKNCPNHNPHKLKV